MRITFLSPLPSLSGGIRAIAAHAEGLSRLGHEVTIVASGPKPIPMRRRVKSLLKGDGWPRPVWHRSHFEGLTGPRFVQLHRSTPITAADVPDGDIVIASWWETAEWTYALPASKGAKVYFVQHHETVFNNQPADRVAATYRLPLPKICVARWIAELMASEYGDRTAQVVPCGIDHEIFTAEPRGKRPQPTVGLMYSPTWFKAVDVATRAIEIARQRVPNLHVVAFGDKPPTGVVTLPAGVDYRLAPAQSEIAATYAAADVWLFSSRSEGFGLPILEAMACRTPVIGTPAGVAPDVLPGGGGRLVPMEDPAAMADAIVDYVRFDDARWRELSDAAFATASRFRWDAATRQFEAYLARLASGLPIAA